MKSFSVLDLSFRDNFCWNQLKTYHKIPKITPSPSLPCSLPTRNVKNPPLRGGLPKSVPLDFGLEKLLRFILIINTTIHPNNETAVRMRKLFILLPFPAFHCWTTVTACCPVSGRYQYPDTWNKNSIFEAPFTVLGKRSISNESWTFQL